MPEYARLAVEDVQWQVSAEFLRQVREGPFRDLRRVLAEAAVLKNLSGKKTVEYDGWLIKVYKRRSGLRHLLRGRPALQELRQSSEILRLGIPTVPVAAVAEWDEGDAVICRKLEGWSSLQDELRRRPSASLIRRYGEFARRVHDAGIDQDDLNPTNVLVREDDLRLVDFERIVVGKPVPRARRIAVLAKLVRPQSLGRERLETFLTGYRRAGEEDLLGGILQAWQGVARGDRDKIRRRCVEENRNFGRLDTPWYVGHFRKESADGTVSGLTQEQSQGLARRPKGFEYRETPDALRAWREANGRTVDGDPVPLAVLVERGRRRGFVVFESDKRPC